MTILLLKKKLIGRAVHHSEKNINFSDFKTFKDSILKMFKYQIEKKTCRIFLKRKCNKTYFFQKQILGCKLGMEWPIYMITTLKP